MSLLTFIRATLIVTHTIRKQVLLVYCKVTHTATFNYYVTQTYFHCICGVDTKHFFSVMYFCLATQQHKFFSIKFNFVRKKGCKVKRQKRGILLPDLFFFGMMNLKCKITFCGALSFSAFRWSIGKIKKHSKKLLITRP